jgi:hypothetical protein
MMVSASIPPESGLTGRPGTAVAAISVAWLAAHLPWLAPSLEDIDSINFALGLREFDPALHQPHPPGYPVYIALGRLSLAVTQAFSSDRLGAEALALAVWSAVGGVVAILAAASFFSTVRGAAASGPGSGRLTAWSRFVPASDPAVLGAALLASAPLFWLTALRPMTDVPGLAATLVALALIAKGIGNRRCLPWGALVAGLAVGIRSQTIWLTLPLLVLAMIQQRGAGVVWLLTRPGAALAAGGVAWAVPLVAASGGIDAYRRALGTQADLDFAGVDMLWLNPTPRRLAFSLYETFVLPWGSVPLAGTIACAAAVGVLVMIVRERRALGLVLVAFAPYAAFHLFLQETLTVRYALPLVPVVAWLAARGLAATGRLAPFIAVPLLGATLVVSLPLGIAYGRQPHPAFRAIDDATRLAATTAPAAMHSHYSLWRPLQAAAPLPFRVVPPRHHVEWLGLVEYWRNGGRDPAWFLADPRRTDLALVDPAARTDVVRYGWAVADRPELSGTRPMAVDWYRIAAPGWFAGEGWSLTPETGGEARANAKGPDQRPIQAWVRRRGEPVHLMIGSRHLGDPGDPAAEFELAIDGRVLDRWRSTVEDPNTLRFFDLPDGISGAEGYATLSVVSHAAGGDGRRAPSAVRQFDVQPSSRLLYGFGEGWHELEYEAATGRLWRWSSDRALLRVHGEPSAVRLTLEGESPLRYFDAPPVVSVVVGGRIVERFSPAADFEWTVLIPADAMAAAGGTITLTQDRAYLPGVAEGTSDERRLGLRLFDVRIDSASP